METPQELEVWYIIPTIRKELAFAMKSNGERQVSIANKLGITKSAVTQYLNNKRAKELTFTPELKKEIKNSSLKIKDKIDAMREIQHILNITRQEKLVCQIHRNLDKDLATCDVCFASNIAKIGRKNE